MIMASDLINNDKNKKIWIVSHYAGGPSYCPRLPDYYLAEYLQRNGYDVLIFAASAVHNTDINFIKDASIFKEEIVDGVPFVFIKTRSYESKIDRVFNMYDFYHNMMRAYKLFEEPALIISAMPQPLSCLAGLKMAKKLKVPHITSIVDLWPLSIVEYADFSDYNPAIRALYGFEKWVYKKSEDLVFTWEGAYDYIIDKGWSKEIPRSKFHYINIGVNLKEYYENLSKYSVDDPDLEEEIFKVMYCGSVRQANDIDTIVECAKSLKQRGYEKKVKFIIYGDGPDRKPLVKKCLDNHIDNVVFKGSIDKKNVPYVLSKSDLCVLNLKAAGTQKYGNSSNKLFEYFAAGSPVVANIDEGKYPIISKYDCGTVVKQNDIEGYADAIARFVDMGEEEYNAYKNRALNAARIFDTETLNAEWERIIRNNLQAYRRGEK